MIYKKLKNFIKKFSFIWKLLTFGKDRIMELSRYIDVMMMMIIFHIWPEQTYRFSTRNHLPSKKTRLPKKDKNYIPYNLLHSKSSVIEKMKEINIVCAGSSFDLNKLNELNGPIFLISFWGPIRKDENGKLIYTHIYNPNSQKFNKVDEIFKDNLKDENLKKRLTYCISRERVVPKFKKAGYKVIGVNVYPAFETQYDSSYLNIFDHDRCKRIAIFENLFLPSHPIWAPSKSVLPNLCALSFFADKVNVYGWDFYLNSSPEKMSYWQLFFNMYKSKYDIRRGRDHFESALINFYYGYQFSRMPKFKIHGYMGKLNRHHKLIKRIEKVLFN